jgi:o-succinylbenzoate---CoA ligase
MQAPPGPVWQERLREAWEAGAAVLPVDHRISGPAVAAVLERARPTIIELEPGVRHRVDGRAVPDGIGLAIATSGSTGRPTTVLLSRSALEAAIASSARRLGLQGETWACPIPVSHIGGMLVVLRGSLLGVPVTYSSDPLGAPEGWASVVPTQLSRLAADARSLHGHRFLVGGARLDPGLRRVVEDLGAQIVATYGMTETSGGVVYDGKPLDGVEARIGPGSRIELSTPTLASFIRTPAGDEQLATDEGWFLTRDTGRMDQGNLEVTGRMDRVIMSGAEKVDPSEVEAALLALPSVRSATAFGLADDEWGTRLALRIDADLTDADISDFLRERFGPGAKPASIERP